MNDGLDVVVVIPYFGYPEFIRRAVDSVLAQTYRRFTVIVVNDGDQEGPWEQLADIEDRRLHRVELTESFGPYFAFEAVRRCWRFRYLVVQDADDWSAPTRVDKLLMSVRSHKSDAALSSHRRYADEQDSEPVVQAFSELLDAPITPVLEIRGRHHGMYDCTTLGEVGGYYAGFRVQYDMFVVNLLKMYGRISYVAEPLYHRIKHAQSLTLSTESGYGSAMRLETAKRLEGIYDQCYAAFSAFSAGGLSRRELSSRLRAAVSRYRESDLDAYLDSIGGKISKALDGRDRKSVTLIR